MTWLGTCDAFPDTMQSYGVVLIGADSCHSRWSLVLQLESNALQ